MVVLLAPILIFQLIINPGTPIIDFIRDGKKEVELNL